MFKANTFSLEQVLRQLADLDIQFSVHGASTRDRYAFKSLRQVEEQGIYFLVGGIQNPPAIRHSIILHPEESFGGEGNVTIRVGNPQLVFYQLMASMVAQPEKPAGIHATAIVGEGCEIDPGAYVGPYCVLEDCVVKAGARLHSHVTVMSGTTIEEDVTIESHSTIGATGSAWVWNPATRRRVIQPQIGYTKIGRSTFLGSNISVVRGSVNETTSIGEGCVIAPGSKIGHGSRIGDYCHFANNVAIAGNVTLGRECFLGSGAVVRPQTRLAERTVVGAGATVVQHCDEPGQVLMGTPARPVKSATDKMVGVPEPLDSEEAK